MIRFYHGSGATDFEVGSESLSDEQWNQLRGAAIRLLESRGQNDAATLLEEIPFRLHDGSNYFQDEFKVLYCSVPNDRYVGLSTVAADPDRRTAFRIIAKVFEEIGHYVRHIAVGLDIASAPVPVSRPRPENALAVVQRALDDAEHLMNSRGGPTSAVDRVHTALHGYLKGVCRSAGIQFADDAAITELFSFLRQQHPAFSGNLPSGEPLHKLLRPMAVIVETLNSIRNQRSMAHANELLLDEPEAMLVINSTKTLLHYLESRLKASRPVKETPDVPF